MTAVYTHAPGGLSCNRRPGSRTAREAFYACQLPTHRRRPSGGETRQKRAVWGPLSRCCPFLTAD